MEVQLTFETYKQIKKDEAMLRPFFIVTFYNKKTLNLIRINDLYEYL